MKTHKASWGLHWELARLHCCLLMLAEWRHMVGHCKVTQQWTWMQGRVKDWSHLFKQLQNPADHKGFVFFFHKYHCWCCLTSFFLPPLSMAPEYQSQTKARNMTTVTNIIRNIWKPLFIQFSHCLRSNRNKSCESKWPTLDKEPFFLIDYSTSPKVFIMRCTSCCADFALTGP